MLVALVAAIPAMLMMPAAECQIAKEKPVSSSDTNYKYEAYAGWAYTSLNQVSQSNSGLQGVDIGLRRDFGRFFALEAEGGHYQWIVTKANPYRVSVNQFLAGPVLHAPLYGNTSLFVRGLIGAAHTGGVPIQPADSFAGGVGIGLEYKLSGHFGLRAYGDAIGSSFTVTPYQTGDSPHLRWNARGGIGVTYSF